MKEITGNYSGKGKKIAIIISRFNEFVSGELLSGCVDTLKKSGVDEKDLLVIWTPGAFEIPQVLNKIDTKKVDAIITLGAVIRGDTPHFDYVCTESSRGIMNLTLEYETPLIFWILTCENEEQVKERIGDNFAISGLNLLAEINKLK